MKIIITESQLKRIINEVGGIKIENHSNKEYVSLFKSGTITFAITSHPVSIKMNGPIKRLIGESIKEILR